MTLIGKIALKLARTRRPEAPFCGAFRLHFGHFYFLILTYF